MSEIGFADVVVVGGGSCGSVVASRLSEDPSCTVVVLESGPGFRTVDDVPAEVLDAHVLPVGPGSPWIDRYPAELTPSISREIARGRILGGSGAVNGAYFIRARPADFSRWPDFWSFDAVLPYFRVSENDADFGGDVHGASGPMPVSRVKQGASSKITDMFVDAALAAGFAADPDKNDPNSSGGVGPVPRNIFGSVRTNAALAYLIPSMLRQNLTVLDRTTVLGVTFEGMRASGVTMLRNGEVSHMRAGKVVLSAGAVRTPQLLMLSGIGPSKQAAEFDIPVVADHPRVGQGFSDHPEIGVYYKFSEESPAASPIEAVLHVDDLEIRPYSSPFDRMIPGLPIGDPMFGIGLMRSEARGHISLLSNDPADAPMVRYRYLESGVDRSAMGVGLDLVDELMSAVVPMASVAGDRLTGRLGTSLHLSGSCAMGDDGSVLDDHLRVRGVEDLYVVDTSAFPVVPTRGPHATAIMLAERASDIVRGCVA